MVQKTKRILKKKKNTRKYKKNFQYGHGNRKSFREIYQDIKTKIWNFFGIKTSSAEDRIIREASITIANEKEMKQKKSILHFIVNFFKKKASTQPENNGISLVDMKGNENNANADPIIIKNVVSEKSPIINADEKIPSPSDKDDDNLDDPEPNPKNNADEKIPSPSDKDNDLDDPTEPNNSEINNSKLDIPDINAIEYKQSVLADLRTGFSTSKPKQRSRRLKKSKAQMGFEINANRQKFELYRIFIQTQRNGLDAQIQSELHQQKEIEDYKDGFYKKINDEDKELIYNADFFVNLEITEMETILKNFNSKAKSLYDDGDISVDAMKIEIERTKQDLLLQIWAIELYQNKRIYLMERAVENVRRENVNNLLITHQQKLNPYIFDIDLKNTGIKNKLNEMEENWIRQFNEQLELQKILKSKVHLSEFNVNFKTITESRKKTVTEFFKIQSEILQLQEDRRNYILEVLNKK